MSKIIAQFLVCVVCVVVGFALGRMYPAEKGPAPRPASPGTNVSDAPRSGTPGLLPTPKGPGSSTTPISAAPTTGPLPPDHSHDKG